MANYLSLTEQERKQMLAAIGAGNVDDLFDDIPKAMRLQKLNIAEGMSEQEVLEKLTAMSAQNKVYRVIMRGAGAYNHFIPPVVKNLSSRSEFVTAYTPYQPEISQGILQSIFEYQSMICALTGMDVSNASVYSGATAAADAALMCITPDRNKVLVPDNIKPHVLEVLRTYLSRRGGELVVLPSKDGVIDYAALPSALDDGVGCMYFEQPNYFGLIEDAKSIIGLIHDAGAKAVMGVNPIAAALLRTPGELGADIAVGDAGCLGLPLSFGGPYIGFIACAEKDMVKQPMVRKMPGRIVGETVDAEGRRAFVLTLQTREQHIKREKALSNICSNQAYCALVAGMYMTAMGPEGMREVAESCMSLAHYAANKLTEAGVQLKYSQMDGDRVVRGEFFHEFVTVHKCKAEKILDKLEREDILGGLDISTKTSNEILWCFTETVKKDDIDKMVAIVKKA